ncbi:MAG: M50 family metallopeptidase [Vicinamibacteria bacterium]|jgi:Zn-dependent protease|nr:M50 family metallopeptidase [Vicinamibacteria bacterium]
MLPTQQGGIRLFRFAGIDVFLHWSWFVVALYEIQARSTTYDSWVWNAAEYLTLFVFVLMHEFGHSLACRQVGGRAEQIVLWPLGGVAYVDPPQRPGATLWSIAAGPLVNVILWMVLTVLFNYGVESGWRTDWPGAYNFLDAIYMVNVVILVFNLMPVYPLDGGQILRSLLWFVIGRARSLIVATAIGFLGVLGLAYLAISRGSFWLGILAFFMATNCWRGFQQARVLLQLAKLPRREGFACPSCRTQPPRGEFWVCGQCRNAIDIFAHQSVCPFCQAHYIETHCLDCGRAARMHDWVALAVVPRVS